MKLRLLLVDLPIASAKNPLTSAVTACNHLKFMPGDSRLEPGQLAAILERADSKVFYLSRCQ